MREITPENAGDYLRETGRAPEGRAVEARALGWGVSNVVIRVDIEGEPTVVLKQARARLRVESLWESRLERIWTEREALGLLGKVLPEGTVPRVLFSDEPNYLFGMSLAPEPSTVWKEQLLAGDYQPEVARRAGELLGSAHAGTRGRPELDGGLADLTVFDELRIDPFYRTAARAHPDFAPTLDALGESLTRPGPDRCLVLGDFSPKNMLVHPGVNGGLTLVDFETAHAGDPAYDLGFFLAHLFLKSFQAKTTDARHACRGLQGHFRQAYRDAAPGLDDRALWQRALGHMAGNILARVDGKSPVDYLDEPARDAARRLALALMRDPIDDWDGLKRLPARDMRD